MFGFNAHDGVGLNVSNTINRTTVDLTQGVTGSSLKRGDTVHFDGNYTDLPAGDYRIYFVNDTDIGTWNIIPENGAYAYLRLTDYIDITISERT